MTEQEEKRVRDFGLFFYLWSLLSLAALALGIYAIIDFARNDISFVEYAVAWIQDTDIDISAVPDLGTMKYWIIGGVVALFLFGILLAYLEIWIMSFIGAEFVSTVVFGVPLAILGGGIACIIFLDPIWIGIGITALAVMLLVIILLVSRRIVLGAKIFETSCEAVNENKRTLIPILIFAIASLVIFILGSAASVWVIYNMESILWLSDQETWVQWLVFFGVIYVYFAIYWTTMYFLDAVNICMFKRWNNYKDASIRYAMKEVWKVKGSIVMFGMFMAFFDWIVKIVQYFGAKKIKETSKFYKAFTIMKKVLYWVFIIFVLLFKWLFKIIKFLNYYTLTIIIVEKQGFIRSIARSSDLALDSGADIIIGKTGVNIAKGLFSVMTFAIFAVAGFFVGRYWFGISFSSDVGELALFGAAVSVFFFIFGYLPMTALLKPLNTAYQTILFYYIADPFRGKTGRRTRLSDDIQESLSKVREKVMESYDKEERTSWSSEKIDKQEQPAEV
ncbi:MAG: hypothetical protein ACTSUP_07195 [Candidatus Heimdallarchaeaceae archaeon]